MGTGIPGEEERSMKRECLKQYCWLHIVLAFLALNFDMYLHRGLDCSYEYGVLVPIYRPIGDTEYVIPSAMLSILHLIRKCTLWFYMLIGFFGFIFHKYDKIRYLTFGAIGVQLCVLSSLLLNRFFRIYMASEIIMPVVFGIMLIRYKQQEIQVTADSAPRFFKTHATAHRMSK